MRRRRGSCPTCGAAAPKGARFCPECGSRLEGDGVGSTAVLETPPAETGPVPVSVASVEPRLFGVTPPVAVLALGVVALAVAVLLLATGRWLPGALALAAAVLLLGAFAEVARRKPGGRLARVSAQTLGRARARAGYAVGAFATRSRAAGELARARARLLELEREREDGLRALGEAAYRGDDDGAKGIRELLADLDGRIERTKREMEAIVAEAQARVERSRVEVQPTERVEAPEAAGPEDGASGRETDKNA